ncbi:MAG: DUF4395 domain-containing protein [Sedimentisphaerales bacterium]|nr:DUF4395 domain-containing protein [Sedimentisphaerales bacterium]
MAAFARGNFVRQQGFPETQEHDCAAHYSALMFQPRVVGIIVLVGLVFQTWPVFLALAAVLWWNVLVPALNPFDLFFNRFLAGRKGLPRLTPAPAPRRFAQGMAGTFMLAVGAFLLLGWQTAAWGVEALLVVALSALVLGRFCLGSYIFHLLRGRTVFANRTLPWTHSH